MHVQQNSPKQCYGLGEFSCAHVWTVNPFKIVRTQQSRRKHTNVPMVRGEEVANITNLQQEITREVVLSKQFEKGYITT